MESDENIPAASLLELFPTEIWLKIVSFLPLHDRCRLEGVNRQLSKVVKSSWDKLQLKALWISSSSVDSAPKLLTLLRRCGSHLEEILTERHIQLDSEDQLDRLCTNLRVLSFACGSSLSLARNKCRPEVPFGPRVRQLLASLLHLERLQFFGTIVKGNEGNSIITFRDIVPCLIQVQSLQELHLPLTWVDGPTVEDIGVLHQLRVLSLSVPTNFRSIRAVVNAICQLNQLEELHLRLVARDITRHFFTPEIVGSLAESLPNLRSLVLVFQRYLSYLQAGSVSSLIDQCEQLRTLVIVGWNNLEEFPVDLSQHHYRHVPLNIFVADYNLSRFIGRSTYINVVPMPNGQFGDAIDFLSTYRQNGFDFANEKCLQMVKMSKDVGGIWDFAYESEDESDAEDY